ncbi:MAG: hypothetical protein HOF07_01185 [Elusimicrobiaceae bacterium]|jgi:ankyrin repeat protein|nr:hypothetical protein [Elusimicrobiaceae bacterium]MBT4447149.1 hypothetical protein [Candidatus Komeilibacteria bacterium]
MNKLVTKVLIFAFAISMLGTINSYAQNNIWTTNKGKEIKKIYHIFEAIKRHKDTETIKKMIDDTDPANLNISDFNSYTLIHIALGSNNKEILKYLMEKGANPNTFNNLNNAPIHTAIYARNLEMVKVLIENGADINLKDKKPNIRHTPLTLAIDSYQYAKYSSTAERRKQLRKASTDIAKYLVDAGADLGIENAQGYTPFQLASHTSQKELAKYIATNDKYIATKTRWGNEILNDIYHFVENW